MQCDDLGPEMLEYLAGTLPDDRLAEIRAHLAQCQACRDEIDATAELWNELGATPAPRPESARMRARFDAALQGYIDGQAESRVVSLAAARRPAVQWQPWLQLSGAAALIVIGVGLGRFVTVALGMAVLAEPSVVFAPPVTRRPSSGGALIQRGGRSTLLRIHR